MREQVAVFQQLFEEYLKDNAFFKSPQELYDPINYILNIGGKRIRPVLLLLSARLFEDRIEKALPAAFAIEMFHNFSLVHDDIMDEAPLRRGKKATHIKFGITSGILSGDVMLIYAYRYLLNYNNVGLIRIFNQLAIEVCEGQQYDMNFELQDNVSLDSYMKMISLKTAALIAGAMEMGALIGGASKKDAEQLYHFGHNIGIAFQLQDDILDTFGDPNKVGKKPGGDIIQNKKTFLVLKSLEIASAEKRQELKKLMEDTQTEEMLKVKAVTELFREIGVEAFAQKQKEKHLRIAMEHLDKVNSSEEKKSILRMIATSLTDRQN